MTYDEHITRAEKLLAWVERRKASLTEPALTYDQKRDYDAAITSALAEAQVHATLAVAKK